MKSPLIFVLMMISSHIGALEVRVSDSRQSNIYMDALVWLLDKSGVDYNLVYTDHPVSTQKRKVVMVRNNEIDVLYAGYTRELDEHLKPIPVPITRGLIGKRLLIINQKSRALYQDIHSIEELRNHSALLGFGWPEIELFADNQLPVYERIYDEIFLSIDAGNPGYFSRGVLEIYGELDDRQELTNLTVQETLLLSYSSAVLFFVHPNNSELAQAIQLGFDIGYQDGSYEKFLYSHPLVVDSLKKAQINERHQISINNQDYQDFYQSIPAAYWHR